MSKIQIVYDKARGRIKLAKIVKQMTNCALTSDKGEDVTEWAVECVAAHMKHELEESGKKSSAYVYYIPGCGILEFIPEKEI